MKTVHIEYLGFVAMAKRKKKERKFPLECYKHKLGDF